ncbi:MAG: hypothetical protein P1U69_05870 [Parvibaculaceae bacterium]|nr:hypothetical protein [Parvibaculaceae bacterium]
MEITDIWIRFGEHIHQDFLIDFPDFFSGIPDILRNCSAEQKQELQLFLKELMSANISSDERLEAWLASEANIFVTTDQIDAFIQEIAKTVEKDLKSHSTR